MEIYDAESKIELRTYEALKKVIDPEFGISIIDLGLVYNIDYTDNKEISIVMTLTTEGCPMKEAILAEITTTMNSELPEVKHCVYFIWTPKWSSDFIKPNGKMALGIS
jgi:metal-sulfur cluster biosynthetic enzyme